MIPFKAIFGILAIIISFIGYYPYIKDTISGKTKPHLFTWFIWGISTVVTYALQVVGGAGSGSWINLFVIFICALVFILGLRNGKRDITKIDIVFLAFSLLALFIWLVVNQPIWSIVLIVLVDMLSFIPTIRKSWNKPFSETLSLYQINTAKHGLSILALEKYTIVTWLYPLSWLFANAFFSTYLIIRRKQVKL